MNRNNNYEIRLLFFELGFALVSLYSTLASMKPFSGMKPFSEVLWYHQLVSLYESPFSQLQLSSKIIFFFRLAYHLNGGVLEEEISMGVSRSLCDECNAPFPGSEDWIELWVVQYCMYGGEVLISTELSTYLMKLQWTPLTQHSFQVLHKKALHKHHFSVVAFIWLVIWPLFSFRLVLHLTCQHRHRYCT